MVFELLLFAIIPPKYFRMRMAASRFFGKSVQHSRTRRTTCERVGCSSRIIQVKSKVKNDSPASWHGFIGRLSTFISSRRENVSERAPAKAVTLSSLCNILF